MDTLKEIDSFLRTKKVTEKTEITISLLVELLYDFSKENPNKLTDSDIEKMAEEWSGGISDDCDDVYFTKKGFIAGCKAIIKLNK